MRGLDEKSPLSTEREFPEDKPLVGWAASSRDFVVNLSTSRLGRFALVIGTGTCIGILSVIVLMVIRGIWAQTPTCALADVDGTLCTSEYASYQLLSALNGRLTRAAADQHLEAWPTSIATRYMSDTAMYRGGATSASPSAELDMPVLARLVRAEPVPDDSHAHHFSEHCCAVHVRVADVWAREKPEKTLERMGALGMTPGVCEHLYLLVNAVAPNCDDESLDYVRSLRAEICADGFATTVHLSPTPDETLAMLARARTGLSSDTQLSTLASNLHPLVVE